MTRPFNRRRASHQFLCLALAALMPLTPVTAIAQQEAKLAPKVEPVEVINDANLPKAPAQDKTLLADPAGAGQHQPHNLALAVPNTILFVAARPAQLLASPVAEFYPTEVIQAAGLKAFGIDPLTTESIVVALAPTLGGPPCYSVVARFNQPFQLKPGEATEHTVAGAVAGRKYFQSNDPMLPSICPLEESSSLLIAPDYFLRQLLTSKEPPKVTPLAASFAAADQGDDLLAMIDVSQVRALINMGLSQAAVPPELASLKQLPNLVKLVELRLNISRPAPSSLIVTANNEADAEKLVGVFEEMKQLLAAKWTVEAQKQLASEDPVEQAAGRYSLRMARLMDDRLQLEREGDQLILIRSDMTGQGANPLVTTATIGVLVGLLLPAVQAARDAARRNASMNNIKQLMLGLLNYESARGAFPTYATVDPAGKPLLSWRVQILPFLEEAALYKQFHLDEPWDSEHNKTLIAKMPEVFLSPRSKLKAAEGKTNYLGALGEGNFFDLKQQQGRKIASIRDGTSNTIAVVEVSDAAAVTWTKPQDWEPDAANLLKPFDDPRGFLAGFCDGHVQLISGNIDAALLKALLTAAGGEVIDPNGY